MNNRICSLPDNHFSGEAIQNILLCSYEKKNATKTFKDSFKALICTQKELTNSDCKVAVID